MRIWLNNADPVATATLQVQRADGTWEAAENQDMADFIGADLPPGWHWCRVTREDGTHFWTAMPDVTLSTADAIVTWASDPPAKPLP